jgi:hypothetical protein
VLQARAFERCLVSVLGEALSAVGHSSSHPVAESFRRRQTLGRQTSHRALEAFSVVEVWRRSSSSLSTSSSRATATIVVVGHASAAFMLNRGSHLHSSNRSTFRSLSRHSAVAFSAVGACAGSARARSNNNSSRNTNSSNISSSPGTHHISRHQGIRTSSNSNRSTATHSSSSSSSHGAGTSSHEAEADTNNSSNSSTSSSLALCSRL